MTVPFAMQRLLTFIGSRMSIAVLGTCAIGVLLRTSFSVQVSLGLLQTFSPIRFRAPSDIPFGLFGIGFFAGG